MDFEVIDDLTSTDPYAALSANMGRVLNERVTALESGGGSGSNVTITLATVSDIVALFN